MMEAELLLVAEHAVKWVLELPAVRHLYMVRRLVQGLCIETYSFSVHTWLLSSPLPMGKVLLGFGWGIKQPATGLSSSTA